MLDYEFLCIDTLFRNGLYKSIKINIFRTVSKSTQKAKISGALFVYQIRRTFISIFLGLRVQAQNTAYQIRRTFISIFLGLRVQAQNTAILRGYRA